MLDLCKDALIIRKIRNEIGVCSGLNWPEFHMFLRCSVTYLSVYCRFHFDFQWKMPRVQKRKAPATKSTQNKKKGELIK